MPWRTDEYFEVGVYWPNSGEYGLPRIVHSLDQAAAEVEHLKAGHYGPANNSPGCPPSEIHVRRVQTERLALEDLHDELAWPTERIMHGSRGGGKTAELEHVRRLHELLAHQRRLFRMAARENPIIRKAVEIAVAEGLREEDAWLFAVTGLLEQNHTLLEQATMNLSHRPPIIKEVP